MGEKTVLIVDDEKRMADSLRDLLGGEGYLVTAAYGGRQALGLLAGQSYKVVVTDLRMQDVDGLEVIRYVYENHPRSLIIVITGHATTESAIQAVHYQVFDYLRKPFDFDLFRMAIEKAFQKIETDQLREDTAAMMTHDIKIPLTSIMGFASMLYDPDRQAFHPRAGEFVETIRANGQKILDLIENYLTSCKIEAGTFSVTPGPCNVQEIVRDVIASESIEAHRHGQDLRQSVDPALPVAVELDEMLVYRALGNLIQNAIKYGPPAQPIEVRAVRAQASQGVDSLSGEAVRLEVENLLPQNQPVQCAGLFDRFERGGACGRVEGTGIGLYVVNAVARAHGGLAWGQMTGDQKIVFCIELPLIVLAEREP